jgi:putative transposase
MRNPFKYFKTSSEIIRLAVMMYIRFPLSLRNVEDLLHERGIDITHETVRFWWNRFGPIFAAQIRKKRSASMRAHTQWRWHLDEVFVKINGELHYLWRAVDHEGEVLEAYVTKRRDRHAALRFSRKTVKRYGNPDMVVTDRLKSYNAAMKRIGNAGRQKRGAGSTTGPKTLTSRSGERSERWASSAASRRSRNSSQPSHPSTITSATNVT